MVATLRRWARVALAAAFVGAFLLANGLGMRGVGGAAILAAVLTALGAMRR